LDPERRLQKREPDMTNNRLDNVLTRHRNSRVRELASAAFFALVVLFAGVSVAGELPALSSAPQHASRASAAIAARAAAEIESNALWQAAVDEQNEQSFGA
jgi:hypothetical protein